ncbi:hypothetical protein C8A00DRAFT_46436 [Chaetomidium leptoderma]|uniref:Uncharacterized protein n=1 Tax=Chaetomidium leptoderma TaxID=669021 RepID=A0AAN6ZTV9_9PEZI|nr:hypothetical protein C8A00DRAFT_46436 [Chaetomidium leptoderma]
MSLDWENPGRSEVAVTGAFISRQGGQIHHGLGGSSQLDAERRRFDAFRPYLQLEEALKVYVPNLLGIRLPESHNLKWDDLSEKIGLMEKQCKGARMGLWHSLWHKMGQSQEAADAWIAFIPDDYGLSVVKAGLALLAESSADKRQMIFKTFAALRDTLIEAHPERRSFRTNQKVNDCVDRLYQSVVDSIQDMAVWLTSEEKSTWNKVTSKFKRRHDAAPISPENILQTLEEHTKDFGDALSLARDQAIEDTELMSRATGFRTVMIHNEVLATQEEVHITRHNTEDLKAGIDTYTKTVEKYGSQVSSRVERLGGKISNHVSHLSVDMRRMSQKLDDHATAREKENDENAQRYQNMIDLLKSELGGLKKVSEAENRRVLIARGKRIANRELALQESQQASRTLLLKLLHDRQEEMQARIAMLETQMVVQPTKTTPLRKPLLTLDRFCQILARPGPLPPSGRSRSSTSRPQSQSRPPPDLPHLFNHPTKDLSLALAQQETCGSLPSQGQAQSLLRRPEFKTWLNAPSPTLLLADANIESADALAALSVLSVLSATLVTSMTDLLPEDVVVHFFCGLHCRPGDPWEGPGGLVRSLILQLVMRLVDMDDGDGDGTGDGGMGRRWGLGFVDRLGFVRALERHDLQALCQALHLLLGEFPRGVTVYCVVDSVAGFGVDRLFEDFEFVMGCFGAIVEDEQLPVVVKVLLTNVARSTLRIREMAVFLDDPERLIDLSEFDRDPIEISTRVMDDRLRRARTPDVPAWERGQGRRGAQDMDYYDEDGEYYRDDDEGYY